MTGLLWFFLAFGALVASKRLAGLDRPHEVRYRARVVYKVVVFGFLLGALLSVAELQRLDSVLGIACVTAFIRIVLSSLHLSRRVAGATIELVRWPRGLIVALRISFLVLWLSVGVRLIPSYLWVVVAVAIGYFVACVFELAHVVRLEARLGTPIIERRPSEAT